MKRKVAALALGAMIVLAGGACSKDEPTAAPSGGGGGNDVSVSTDNVPVDTAVVKVTVTKAANPQPVSADQLPENVRRVGNFPGLTPEEQTCVNATVKGTVDQDPTIAEVNGKMASVAGQAVVVCAGGGRVAEIMASRVAGAGGSINAEQTECFKSSLAASDENAADLMASALSMNPDVVDKLKQYEQTCGFSFGMPGS